MSQAINAPVATMVVDDTGNQVEKMELVPIAAAASNESEKTAPAFAPDDVDCIMTKAESIGFKSMIVPSSPNAILTFPFYPEIGRHEPQAIIGRLIVKLMKPEELTKNERQIVFNILKALSQIETFTRAAEEALQINFMLTGVLGEWPKASRPYKFPEVFQQAAAAISAKVEGDLDIEEVVDETPPTPTSPPPATTGKKRKRKSPNAGRSAARELPNIHNPSYKGIMCGIVISNEGNASYKLADKSMRVPANVFGHNGLQIGDWWPKWICALRDGAHGRTQGGIYSRLGVGAFSIVVSGLYDELDKDHGSVLYYSGNKSHDNVDPNQAFMTPAITALQQSQRDQRLIRVLRTSGGKASHCPAKGLRYDGLYRIVDHAQAKNKKGGAYVRFKLVRDTNQPDMDLSRPTQAEKDVFDRLKSSI